MGTPSTPQSTRFKAPDTNRDERLRIRTLRGIGWTYEDIAAYTGCTLAQVRHACSADQTTPRRRSGRPSLLTDAQVEELIAFVCTSKATRRMPYRNIPLALGWNCSEYAIRYASRELASKDMQHAENHLSLKPTELSASKPRKNASTGVKNSSFAKNSIQLVLSNENHGSRAGCSGDAQVFTGRGLVSSGKRNGALLIQIPTSNILFPYLMDGIGFILDRSLCRIMLSLTQRGQQWTSFVSEVFHCSLILPFLLISIQLKMFGTG